MNNKKLLSLMLSLVLILVVGTSFAVAEEDPITIGISMKTQNEERWVTELAIMEEKCAELGVKTNVQIANNDGQLQVTQIENMITQGIDILIYVPVESGTLQNVIQSAHDAGILVCSYEKAYGDCYIDCAGGLDNHEVGICMVKPIADTGISGKIAYIGGDAGGSDIVMDFWGGMHDGMANNDVEVVGELWSQKYDAAIAQGHAENLLSQYGEELKAILPMNDGMAGGVAQAVEAAGLTGSVLICGQDCDLTACQRIVAGTQYCTVYKNSEAAANVVIDKVLKMFKGELTEDDYNATCLSASGEEVPMFSVEPVIVTAENLDEVVIDGGIYTHEQVYGE